MSYYLSPDDLFLLVKSMTPGEKRYFRLQSRLYSGDKTYMRFFDLLDQQEEFDMAVMKQKLGRKPATHNFSVLKKYLFDQIIKSLKNYGTYRDSDSDLNELIETYKILEYKGLHRLSERLLLHAKKKAYDDDAFLRLCYILIRQFIKLGLSTSDESMRDLHELIEERKRILEIIRNYSIIGDHLYIQIKMIRRMGKVRGPSMEKALRENIEPLLRMTKDRLLSRTAEGMYNMAMSDYYFAMGDVNRALHLLSGYIRKQSFPRDTSKIEIQQLNEYSYYFSLSLRSKHFIDFEENLDRFRRLISPRNTPVDIVIFERWLLYMMTYLNVNGRFTDAAEFFQSQTDTFDRLKERFSKQSRISIYYALAYSCFGVRDYDRALHYVFMVMDESGAESEVFMFARLLSILIYFEMDNLGAMEYATRSLYRYLLKNERLFQWEKSFLSFIRQLPKSHSREELASRFSDLYLHLDRLFRDSREADIEYYIHIRAWLQSKIEGIDFAQCVKKQLNDENSTNNKKNM